MSFSHFSPSYYVLFCFHFSKRMKPIQSTAVFQHSLNTYQASWPPAEQVINGSWVPVCYSYSRNVITKDKISAYFLVTFLLLNFICVSLSSVTVLLKTIIRIYNKFSSYILTQMFEQYIHNLNYVIMYSHWLFEFHGH